VEARTETIAKLSESGEIQVFNNEDEFFAAGKLADVLIIGTQDSDHFGHAKKALEAGYDLLLEKPASETIDRCEELDAMARSLGRIIVPCFVLRYTPFYEAVKSVIDSGRLGKVMTIHAMEGVEPFHHSHSYVRGHWANSNKSSPMIVAKCSHDTDLLCWLSDSETESVTSHGRLDWFKKENAPAGAPERCTDGCPVADDCLYDTHRYLGDKRNFLRMVMPGTEGVDGAKDASDEAILEFLKTSPWGRCAYRCDNDAVDHQVMAVEMKNGVTASLTMTAFDCGRTLDVFGTRASLRGGGQYQDGGTPELWLRDHRTGEVEAIPIDEKTDDGYQGHGGGDYGLVNSIDQLFRGDGALSPGLDGLAGHRLAFLAEQSRLDGGQPKC